ncbi:MAG: hypothetical protein KL863_09070 [Rhizobium sp.]|nr:hypothetical protein [Rhizobium sp.]
MSNSGRNSTEKMRKALKIASQIVTNMCGGGKLAAGLTDVDDSTLCLYGALHEDKRFMRLDVALDLDLAAGEPIVARALAAAQGWRLTRDNGSAGVAALGLADYGRLQREAFEAQAAVFESLEDGLITTTEKRRILKELADLRQAIAVVEAKVEGA